MKDYKFDRNKIDMLFKELGKEIRKAYGKNAEVELTVVGGASIMMNYEFREATTDIDSIISARSSIKEMINRIADKHLLPNTWLNQDFMRTTSYSNKLVNYSQYFKTYSGVLSVRTINDEYLIAMKLKSFRGYKHDVSDIAGIIKFSDHNMSLDNIQNAFVNIYNKKEWDELDKRIVGYVDYCIQHAADIDLKNIDSVENKLHNSILNCQSVKMAQHTNDEILSYVSNFNRETEVEYSVADKEHNDMLKKGKEIGLPSELLQQLAKTFELMEEESVEKEIEEFVKENVQSNNEKESLQGTEIEEQNSDEGDWTLH